MGNLLEPLPDGPPATELTDLLARSHGGRVERIVSWGHSTGWYDQDEDEWVAVLAGEAVLEYEDGSTEALAAGDWAWLPAHRKHRVAATAADRPTVWLAVFLAPDPT